jgi:hypothetical protein
LIGGGDDGPGGGGGPAETSAGDFGFSGVSGDGGGFTGYSGPSGRGASEAGIEPDYIFGVPLGGGLDGAAGVAAEVILNALEEISDKIRGG